MRKSIFKHRESYSICMPRYTYSHFILGSYFIFQYRRHKVRNPMHFTFKSCLTSCKIKHEHVVLKLPFMMHVCIFIICNRRTNYIWWHELQHTFDDKIKLKKRPWITSSRCYLCQFAMNLEFCLKLYNIFSKPTLEEKKYYGITLL